MADEKNYPVLSVCATKGSRLPDLAITDGQLIFVQDKHLVALDYNGKRVFYNQIEELDTELARTSILAPITGRYYFVIDTAVLWTYRDTGWVQITTPPDEIVFIGTELPELGARQTLYVDTTNDRISVWDETAETYHVVSDKTNEIEETDIEALFA